MAGIYIHIPFCKSRCIYCGFFSTTSLAKRQKYVDAVLRELENRKGYLCGEPIETVYLGGGTPSQLPDEELERILFAVHNIYNVREGAEISIEANPDDVSAERLENWRCMSINRLSMGVQTFHNERLRFLNRRHSAQQAIQAVRMAQDMGFDNISIDLMFGFPGQTLEEWENDLRVALSLKVKHLSAYSLMYEEGTWLNQLRERGKIAELDEEVSLQMYELLIDKLEAKGYHHYELSNFALPGWESRHNSGYWQRTPYLGVGAGAHSFDGQNRCYHADSLETYLSSGQLEIETLTERERYDEYVFTGLRTSKGISLNDLAKRFGGPFLAYCLRNAQKHIDAGRLVLRNQILHLSRAGLFVSNDVMSDLMWTD